MKNQTFLEIFHTATWESINQKLGDCYPKDPAYQKAHKQYGAILDQIQEAFDWDFVNDLERILGGCHIPELDWAYQQGFQDCVALLQWMGLLPNSTETTSLRKMKNNP